MQTRTKLPVVVIVGRPNVGKSTLFNRVIKKRIAVVEDTPGITRDRLYAEAEWNGQGFTVVDTGGIVFQDDDPLVEQIKVQAEVALAEAEVVVFVVDATTGPLAGDYELANRLRGINCPVLLVVNKADNPSRDDMANEFYSLGLADVWPVSGLHGRGVADVLDEVTKLLPKTPPEEVPEEIRVAIVGRPNVGKSSLLNAFMGEVRAIVSNIPGTTRDAIDTQLEYAGERFRLIDTAGMRRRGKIQGSVEYYMTNRALKAIDRADCVLVIVDGSEGLTDGDKRAAKLAHDGGKGCVFVINKWDTKEPPDGYPKKQSLLKKDFLRILRDQIPELAYAPVCFTSATESAGLEPVLDTVISAMENYSLRISTGQLNRIIQDATFERPYSSKGRPFKIYYSTQVGARPPSFAMFCNNPELLHFSYQRYLENRLRKIYPMVGTPIRINMKASHPKKN